MHEASFPPDEGFVCFDSSRHLLKRPRLNCKAKAVQHEPCRLLCYIECAMEFITTDPILATDQQPHSRQPFGQRNRRILKDRSNLDGELPVIMVNATFPDSTGVNKGNFFASATGTDNPIRPTQRHHKFKTS